MRLDMKKLALVVSFLFFLGFVWIARGVHLNAPWVLELDYYGNEVFRLNVAQETTSMIFCVYLYW